MHLLGAALPLLLALERPRLEATRVAAPPVLDGRLDDGAWQAAHAADQFLQRFPDEGEPASERTVVRVVYDDAALYVGIRCDQRRAPLVRRMTRRDREVEAYRVSVAVSSRGDGHSAFRFDVTADGVLADGVYFDDDEFSRDWDETWEAATALDDGGWSVEMRIPLQVLRFQALPVQDWGFNVRRFITARQEVAEWSFTPRTDAGVVSRLGRLENLTALSPRRALELRPFVLGRTEVRDPGYGARAGTSHAASAGLDAKWHPTQDLTVDATVNPDFGQVEADEVVLNLTTCETEHPEKRSFFLAGLSTFATPATVLYPRRIGRVPGAPPRRPGERLAEELAPSPVLGALKVVGRLAPQLTVGALTALTGPNRVVVAGAGGTQEDRLADPTTLYGALRLRWDQGPRGHLGLVATSTDRLGDAAAEPLDPETGLVMCPGGAHVAAGARCLRDAYVAGVDGRWRSAGGSYAAGGQALISAIAHGPARTLRDGTVVAAGDTGALLGVGVAKIAGEHWLWELDSDLAGRKLSYF